jgi:hypothetical protein
LGAASGAFASPGSSKSQKLPQTRSTVRKSKSWKSQFKTTRGEASPGQLPELLLVRLFFSLTSVPIPIASLPLHTGHRSSLPSAQTPATPPSARVPHWPPRPSTPPPPAIAPDPSLPPWRRLRVRGRRAPLGRSVGMRSPSGPARVRGRRGSGSGRRGRGPRLEGVTSSPLHLKTTGWSDLLFLDGNRRSGLPFFNDCC